MLGSDTDSLSHYFLVFPADSKEIHYLQSQNGNLYSSAYFEAEGSDPSGPLTASEFEPLRPYVPPDIDWCSEAMGKCIRNRPSRLHITLLSTILLVLWLVAGSLIAMKNDTVLKRMYTVDRRPDAVNLWIGTGASVTSIHSGERSSSTLYTSVFSRRLTNTKL